LNQPLVFVGEHSREASISTIPSPILIFRVIRLEFVLGETKNSPAAKLGHLRLLFLEIQARENDFSVAKSPATRPQLPTGKR
jgi:hypothetical protein